MEDAVVEKYIQLRNKLAEMERKHEEEVAPVKAALQKTELHFLSVMNKLGVDSFKTKYGTPYKSVKTSASVADWDLALPFIIKHEMWHMLPRSVNKAAVAEYRKEYNDLPPGVNWREEIVVNVRSS